MGTPSLIEAFDAQAESTPQATALRQGEDSTSFAELARRANAFASGLGRAGIGEGGYVGLHVDRSIDYVTALLGVLKAGAAVVPLPPSYPEGRLRDILDFATLDAIVDHARSPLRARGRDRVIRFDATELDAERDATAKHPTRAAFSPDRPAFLLCTSGSTGHPKLIVRGHRSFFHRLEWTWKEHPYTAGEVCCQKSFMTTTHAVYELFEPLLRGVPVWILPDHDVRDLATFWDTVRDKHLSRLLVVPSFLQASLEHATVSAPALKLLVLMGEHVPAKLASMALGAFPESTRIVSIYGSTEASSTLVCDVRKSFRDSEELPLGTPISPEVRAHVLDAGRKPVQPGSEGLLHIAGPALFAGYFKDEPLTASVLRQANGGELLYDTRDRVSVLPDGNLRYVGRVDDTVKVRGFRVDIHEVERTMLLHPELRHAAVVAKADGTGTFTLHGFYSPVSVEPASVYDILRRRLPEYMVPSALVGVDSFPLLPSGKTNRQRLLLESRIAPAKPGPDRPRTPTEARVIDVVRSVLGEHEIDPIRSFFEIGGTSLAAFALMHRVREAFGLGHQKLGDQTIYQFSSVETLASHIDALSSGAAVAPTSNAVLVTLRTAADPALPPFFLISSAGGTLGAYQKLTKALETKRELIGVRDPFVWGARDATQGFVAWVDVYLDAIRERQPHGPYEIGAYSSASVFGYEIARRLRELGEEVRLLALIDPLALDFSSRRRFGYWAFHARIWRPRVKPLVLLGGLARRAALAALPERASPAVDPDVSKPEGFERIANDARNDQDHILGLSVLLELNTGLPFALGRSELARLDSSRYVDALIDKVQSVSPEVDAASIRNMIVQYRLQTRAQFRYRLRKYDGRLVLVEPEGPHRGLFESQFRPFVRQLRSVSAPLAPSERQVRLLDEAFQPTLHAHYLSMRDDRFVQATARVLDEELAKSASDG